MGETAESCKEISNRTKYETLQKDNNQKLIPEIKHKQSPSPGGYFSQQRDSSVSYKKNDTVKISNLIMSPVRDMIIS